MTDAARPPFWPSLATLASAEVVGIAHLLLIVGTRHVQEARPARAIQRPHIVSGTQPRQQHFEALTRDWPTQRMGIVAATPGTAVCTEQA